MAWCSVFYILNLRHLSWNNLFWFGQWQASRNKAGNIEQCKYFLCHWILKLLFRPFLFSCQIESRLLQQYNSISDLIELYCIKPRNQHIVLGLPEKNRHIYILLSTNISMVPIILIFSNLHCNLLLICNFFVIISLMFTTNLWHFFEIITSWSHHILLKGRLGQVRV